MAIERVDGATPNGGDYTLAVFVDDEGNEVEKAKATQVMVSEFTLSGYLVAETTGTLTPSV